MNAVKRTSSLFVIFLVLIIAACVHKPDFIEQLASERTWELEEIIPIDPQVSVGTLDNGLTFYIRTNSKPENRAELRLVVNVGSVLEDKDQQGLAHFVEHMAFNSTRHFQKQEIVDFLETIGMRFGPELNAYTGFDETVYMLQVPTEDREVLEKAVQVLEDWAHLILFNDEEIDKERLIIIEEWRIGRGAAARMRDKQFPVLYKDSRYAERLPIGKLEIIENCDSEQLIRFYQDWYRPELMAVIAVGDFDRHWMEELIRRKFSNLKQREDPRERRIFPVPNHEETLYAPAADPEATSTRVSIYIKHEVLPFLTVRDYRRMLIEYMYNVLLNDRLEELTKQPQPPFISGFSWKQRNIRSKELYILSARVQDERIMEGLEALLTEAERVRRYGFTESELKRKKEQLLKWMKNVYNERENIESQTRAEAFIDHFLEQEPVPDIEYEYELYKRYIPEINLEEVNRQAYQWLTENNRVILVNAPEKPKGVVPDESELLALFQEVQNKQIEPYEDMVSDKPLISASLKEAEITGQKEIAELGLTEWTLVNGIRVVLKPTDFKNDQVLFASFSPGGHSLVTDEEYIAGATASAVVVEGGVGEFNLIELQKKLAGKVVEVSPWIGDLYEGIEGEATPEDLETMFQLIYLYFTSPRLDESAFLAYQARLGVQLENRQASPEATFWDTVQTVITQNHFRRRPWDSDILDEMSLESSYRIYNNRFQDAGDFTFFFVGNFKLDQIEALINKYLGTLPSMGRIEAWRDSGIDPPQGVIERTVKKGMEPKSQVLIVFSGPFSWDPVNRLNLRALAEILDIQLREVVREEAGGTYDIGVEAVSSHYPDEEYHVYIGFGCAPEQVEELSALVFEQIDFMRREGPTEINMNKINEIFKRERETKLKENEFWLQALQFHYAHKLDPRNILHYEELVDNLNVQSVRQTAQNYMDINNYVRIILYPENWIED